MTSEHVAYSLQTSLTGIDLTQYREGNEIIPVTLRTEAAYRQDFGKLEGLRVFLQSTGRNVPLKQVADAILDFEHGVIERRDREQSLNVQLFPSATAATVAAELKPWLDEPQEDWPQGHKYVIGGETKESGDANASIAAALPTAAMLIQLLVANSTFGFFALIGLISLSGIVINNAIVPIDRIAIEIGDFGRSPGEAVFYAAQQRLRPILLTTATTVLGMTPLLWGGTAMFLPMAISIIFALAFETALTLLVVPVLYTLCFRVALPGRNAS